MVETTISNLLVGIPMSSFTEDNRYSKPKTSSNVQVKFFKKDERGDFYIIGIKGRSNYLKIHSAGKEIIEMLDGNTSVADITESLRKKNIEANVPRFIKLLAEEGFLENIPPLKIREKSSSLMIHYIPLLKRTEYILKALYSVFRSLFRKELLVFLTGVNFIILATFLSAMLVGYIDVKEFFFLRSSMASAISIYAFLIMPLLIAIHEFSHALVCFHYGGKPKEMGIALFIFVPFFYSDTTDVWMLDKRQSIMVFLAGPLSTFFIGNLCVVLSFLLPTLYSSLLRMAAFGAYIVVLIGFNPLFESDGYFILQTLTDFPNLISHARNYVLLWLKSKIHRLSGKDEEQMESYSKHERKILAIYAPSVLLINSVFVGITVYWGAFFAGDYWGLILSVKDTFPSVPIYTLIEFSVQSVFLAFMMIFLISTIKKLIHDYM